MHTGTGATQQQNFSTHSHEKQTGKEKGSTKVEYQKYGKGLGLWKEKGEPQIRIVSYNPLALSSEGRLDDICHHFKGRAVVIILQGTTTKDWTSEGRPVTVKSGGFWSVQWRWHRRSEGSNKSCGVLVLFCGKRFPDSGS